MSVSHCQQALDIACTYMLQTCMYTFIIVPCGQDSRCTVTAVPVTVTVHGPSVHRAPGRGPLPVDRDVERLDRTGSWTWAQGCKRCPWRGRHSGQLVGRAEPVTLGKW